VIRWISGFLWAFRPVCRGGDVMDFWVFVGVPAGVPPVVLGGLCTVFIRRAYLHTTSSVLVRRATVGVGNVGLCVCLPCCPSVSVCTLCARRAHAVRTPYVCASEWSRGTFRSLGVLHDGRGGRVHAPHARHATIFFF
jgi:hypothetical protein